MLSWLIQSIPAGLGERLRPPRQPGLATESLVAFIRRSPLVGAGGLDLGRLADPVRDPMA